MVFQQFLKHITVKNAKNPSTIKRNLHIKNDNVGNFIQFSFFLNNTSHSDMIMSDGRWLDRL